MAAAEGTVEGTAQPAEHAGLPQMDVGTFPSQVFWLAITFGRATRTVSQRDIWGADALASLLVVGLKPNLSVLVLG